MEEIDRTIEWWVRRRYDLDYVITQIKGMKLPDILKDPKILACVQNGIRNEGRSYAQAIDDCVKFQEITSPQQSQVLQSQARLNEYKGILTFIAFAVLTIF